MNCLKLLCARLFGWTLVWTVDHDGEHRMRRVHFRPDGTRRCHAVLSDMSVELNDDGTTGGKGYVERWEPCHPLTALPSARRSKEEEWAEYIPGGRSR